MSGFHLTTQCCVLVVKGCRSIFITFQPKIGISEYHLGLSCCRTCEGGLGAPLSVGVLSLSL